MTESQPLQPLQANILKDGRKVWYVTVATKPHPFLDILTNLCTERGIHIAVMGMNDQRLQEWGKGFGVKIYYLKEAVQQLEIIAGSNDLVIFTDAYDVLITEDLDTIVKKFDTFKSDVVFSTEVYCHPDKELAPAYPALKIKKKDGTVGEPNHPFLNSGAFMGKVHQMADFMQEYKYEIRDDDQRYWTNIYLKEFKKKGTGGNLHAISLDTESSLFQCMAGANHEIEARKADATPGNAGVNFVNSLTGESPSFIHFNGPKEGLSGFHHLLKNGMDSINVLGTGSVMFISIVIAMVFVIFFVSVACKIPNMEFILILLFLFIFGFLLLNKDTNLFLLKPRSSTV